VHPEKYSASVLLLSLLGQAEEAGETAEAVGAVQAAEAVGAPQEALLGPLQKQWGLGGCVLSLSVP
jgi:hypothetical protein